ncbi:MAG: response regulator transcription factor [Bacteroidales bacterium]|nr:response regulator transcription factor [Bacteroidales bacterium]
MNTIDDVIKISIVDDHELFRNGVKMVLSKMPQVKVIGEYPSGNIFLLDLIQNQPDIVLMDIRMPDMDGIETTRLALKKTPSLKVIALTMFGEDDYIESMMEAGAKGFLLKNISKETLEKAIHAVMNGKYYFSEELFEYFTRQISREKEKHTPIEVEKIQFTRREKEILQLLCEGLSNKEIAEALCISERTVLNHKANLMAKTNTKNSIALMAYAIKNKIVVI